MGDAVFPVGEAAFFVLKKTEIVFPFKRKRGIRFVTRYMFRFENDACCRGIVEPEIVRG